MRDEKHVFIIFPIILKCRKFKDELIEKYSYRAISKDAQTPPKKDTHCLVDS